MNGTNVETIEMEKVIRAANKSYTQTCYLHHGASVVFLTRIHKECPLCKIELIRKQEEKGFEKMNQQLSKVIG